MDTLDTFCDGPAAAGKRSYERVRKKSDRSLLVFFCNFCAVIFPSLTKWNFFYYETVKTKRFGYIKSQDQDECTAQ